MSACKTGAGSSPSKSPKSDGLKMTIKTTKTEGGALSCFSSMVGSFMRPRPLQEQQTAIKNMLEGGGDDDDDDNVVQRGDKNSGKRQQPHRSLADDVENDDPRGRSRASSPSSSPAKVQGRRRGRHQGDEKAADDQRQQQRGGVKSETAAGKGTPSTEKRVRRRKAHVSDDEEEEEEVPGRIRKPVTSPSTEAVTSSPATSERPKRNRKKASLGEGMVSPYSSVKSARTKTNKHHEASEGADEKKKNKKENSANDDDDEEDDFSPRSLRKKSMDELAREKRRAKKALSGDMIQQQLEETPKSGRKDRKCARQKENEEEDDSQLQRSSRKADNKRKRQQSSTPATAEKAKAAEAKRPRRESPAELPTISHSSSGTPTKKLAGGRKDNLEIDMVQNSFTPSTSGRFRSRSNMKSFKEVLSPPAAAAGALGVLDKIAAEKRSAKAAGTTTPNTTTKRKLKVSTIKNYESEEDASSGEESDKPKSGGNVRGDNDGAKARKPQRESPAAAKNSSLNRTPQKAAGKTNNLEIDMVQNSFTPSTSGRFRSRSTMKSFKDVLSPPAFGVLDKIAKEKMSARTAAPTVTTTTTTTKRKLKVSTIKNYESDEDISSEEGSDNYKSGSDDEDEDDDVISDEDEEMKKKPGRTKSKKDDQKKKKKGGGGDEAKKKAAAAAKRRVMTPRIPSRSVPLPKVVSPLQEAQLRLHVGAVPDGLPCREDEFAEIFSFTEGKIQEGIGGCMYISGLPGTGKTATVKEVVRTLEEERANGDLPDFRFIEVNGMRLTEPNQAYVQIWQGLTGGEKVTAEHARNLLEARFTKSAAADKKSQKSTTTTVLLVDELDMLWNKKQSVLYNVFEWPTYKSAKLIVLAIANTMDLPERVMINRVSSRVGLTRLTFSPYTHEQLTEIVAARLQGLTVFDKDAVQLVARKVSSLSGDARRALDICRRATEIAQRQMTKNQEAMAKYLSSSSPTKKNSKKSSSKRNEFDEGEEQQTATTIVGMSHVTQAHKEMFCSPKMMAIRCCSPFEKMLLQSLVAIFCKTGIEETTFGRAHTLLSELSVVEGYKPVSTTVGHSVLSRLVFMRLVLAEPGKSGRLDMKIRLNVSTDDVNFALKKDYA